MSFKFTISTQGNYMASFVFKDEKDVLSFLSGDFKKLSNKYGKLTARIGTLDELKVGDTCFVNGEGSDTFKIEGIVERGHNNVAYLLDSGFTESASKCFKNWNRKAVPEKLKMAVQKLAFATFKVEDNWVYVS